jgi:hypothetical protein
MNQVTEWRSASNLAFFPSEFKGDKAKKDYDFTLLRKITNSETEVSEITVDFGDYLEEESFFIENDDMRIKLYAEWNGRW